MKLTIEDRKALQDVMNVLMEILQQSPEVPERLEVWPEDDTHLQGEFWEDKERDIFRFSDGRWEVWQPATRQWMEFLECPGDQWAPFTRATDPSLPRTWDTLDDVPEDVERATGDYAGMRRELARSPLSESGWFQRIQDNAPRRWTELPETETNNITNIQEEQ